VNDIPPVFTSVPRPITLDDDVPIGTTVIDLVAADSDGTAPGNQVGVLTSFQYLIFSPLNKQKDRFSPSLISVGSIWYHWPRHRQQVFRNRSRYRRTPSTRWLAQGDWLRVSGIWSSVYNSTPHIARDLAHLYNEVILFSQIDVLAYDMGDPPLSSETTVTVYVRHVATVPPEIGLGFAENSYNVEVPEDAGDNTLIKIITIINSHAYNTTPLRCEIYSGNEEGLFEANVTKERNCALRLKKGALDYETTESYQIKIKLESLSGLLNSGRNTTMVRNAIELVGVFILCETRIFIIQIKYYVAIILIRIDILKIN